MMKTYRINTKSYFRHLWSIPLLTIVMPIIGYYMMIAKMGEYAHETALIVGLIFFVVFIGPILTLHFNHQIKSKGSSIYYDEQLGKLTYNKKRLELKFKIKDIKVITIYKSWPMGQGRLPLFPWDVYNYAVIELKDGQVLKISSLLVYELDKVVKFENTKIKKTLYAWMS